MTLLICTKLDKKLLKQIFIFLLVGAICYLLDVLLVKLLSVFINIEIVFLSSISYLMISLLNYYLNRKFVFKPGRHRVSKEFAFFLVLAIVLFFLNGLLVYYINYNTELPYFIIKAIIILILTIFSFMVRKFFIFLE